MSTKGPKDAMACLLELLKTRQKLDEINRKSYDEKINKDFRRNRNLTKSVKEVQGAVETLYEAQMDPDVNKLLNVTFKYEDGKVSSLDPVQRELQQRILEGIRASHERMEEESEEESDWDGQLSFPD